MTIKLKSLELENFMMYGHADFDFHDKTIICGMNGRGKSSIVNSYMWLLFNCSYDLADNPVVRHEVNGEPVKDSDVSVIGIFDIDGTETKVQKIQKRKYGKDGVSYKDDNSYFINDVPKTLTAFNEQLGISKEMRMCCNVNAFLNQKPVEMREYLFSIIDGITDLEIAKKNPDLSELAELLSKYTTEELLAMNKKVVSDTKKNLPVMDGQIKEKERDISIKADKDVAELELLKNSLTEQLKENETKQADNLERFKTLEKNTGEILTLKMQLNSLQAEANKDLDAKRADFRRKKDAKEVELVTIDDHIRKNEREIDKLKRGIEWDSDEKQKLADLWKSVNAEDFNEDTVICPTCKRKLAKTKIDVQRKRFDSAKMKRLQEIADSGTQKKREIEEATARINELTEKNIELSANREKVKESIAVIDRALATLPVSVNISDSEEYKRLQASIENAEKAMQVENDLSEKRKALKNEELELRQQLAVCVRDIDETNTEKDEERLEQLRIERMNMVQKQAFAEKNLHLLDELSKAKNETLTGAINRRFDLVKWQLWELNKSGEYKNTCIPTVDGKSILSTMSNKGNRILGKLDICRSIQRISGLNIPIWLDDCEALDGVNQHKILSEIGSQVILLKVTDDSKLAIADAVR